MPKEEDASAKSGLSNMQKAALLAVGAVTGGVLAPSLVPVTLAAVGFTKLGIAAGSVAASMMSSAAIANGGGVAAGSLVAVLQSVGAAGLSTATSAALGSVGSVLGGYLAHKSV